MKTVYVWIIKWMKPYSSGSSCLLRMLQFLLLEENEVSVLGTEDRQRNREFNDIIS
jgi:hypothetical protein